MTYTQTLYLLKKSLLLIVPRRKRHPLRKMLASVRRQKERGERLAQAFIMVLAGKAGQGKQFRIG